MQERGRAYREQGWESYDPNSPACSGKERQMERDRYRAIHEPEKRAAIVRRHSERLASS